MKLWQCQNGQADKELQYILDIVRILLLLTARRKIFSLQTYHRSLKSIFEMKQRHSKIKQLDLLPKSAKLYGGIHRSKRKARGTRPLASTQTIHLVMRSTKAVGQMSFTYHHSLIKRLIESQALKSHVKVIDWANVGNHLHLHIQLPRLFRESYCRFIRGLTGAIAIKLFKASKLRKVVRTSKDRFWDLRPFTRVLTSWRELLNLRHYILVNSFEGLGFSRQEAEVRAHVKEFDDDT